MLPLEGHPETAQDPRQGLPGEDRPVSPTFGDDHPVDLGELPSFRGRSGPPCSPGPGTPPPPGRGREKAARSSRRGQDRRPPAVLTRADRIHSARSDGLAQSPAVSGPRTFSRSPRRPRSEGEGRGKRGSRGASGERQENRAGSGGGGGSRTGGGDEVESRSGRATTRRQGERSRGHDETGTGEREADARREGGRRQRANRKTRAGQDQSARRGRTRAARVGADRGRGDRGSRRLDGT